MVLEDSTAFPPASTSDYSSPTSDADPYASSSDQPHISLNLEQLPSAAPIFGPLLGYTNQYLANSINYRIQHTSGILQRPTTEDEAVALAYWTAKMLAIASWGRPLGLAAGGWRAYQTRGTFRFPFVKPDPEKFNPEVVKIGGYELMRGGQARIWWHVLRGTAYGLFGSWVGGLMVSTYAATAVAVGEQQDPRLKEVIAKLRMKAKEIAAGIPQGQKGQTVGRKGDPTGQGRVSASDLWKNHRKSVSVDDASPGAEGFDYGAEESDGRLAKSDGGVLSDQQMRGQEQRQQASPGQSPMENRASTFQLEKVERQPRNFDDDYEDASPSSGSEPMDASSEGGSVWERIRKQAGSAPPNAGRGRRAGRGPVQQERQEGSTTGDSFAFSNSEEDRQLAKTEAQRQFDEQVERERRGGDFGGKRW
ncbi:hypothetical protein MMC08_001441 [Hypocenomyce scalaris]|nr:hypothetical protein [Hypocenomyce scalaris]